MPSRLLQSMILEQGSLGFIQEGLEDVTIPLLRQLAKDHKTEVRTTTRCVVVS